MHKLIVDRWAYNPVDTTDVTDVESLRKSEANLNAILNHTESGYVLYDASLRIVAYNKLAQELSAVLYGKRLIKTKHLLSYFPESRHDALRDITTRVLRAEKISYELCFNIDGIDKWIEVKWINVSNPEKKNWGFILTSKDITKTKLEALEREKITAELSSRNKALEQFTNITSHNLRAPVANIINLIEMMSMADSVEEKESMLDFILESSRNLDRVIKDIHHILKAKRHISELKEEVNLQSLVNDIKLSIHNIISAEQAVIHCDFTNQKSVTSIRSFMHNILYNLILNSLKYRDAERSPEIFITAKKKGKYTSITVADNGKGIDLTRHGENLFGLYKRFDSTVEGSGLGLFMVKSQVEELGGTINVESKPGTGTTFIIEIPTTVAQA